MCILGYFQFKWTVTNIDVLCRHHGNHKAKPLADTQTIKESKHITTVNH